MAKTDTVRKRATETGDVWAFMHPTTHAWTGEYKTRDEARAARTALKPAKTSKAPVEKKVVDNAEIAPVDSHSTQTTSTDATSTDKPGDVAQPSGEKKMNVTFNKSTKARKSTSIVYTAANGLRGSLRVAKTFFKGGTAPDTLVIDSDAFAEPKSKMTAEERKAARANAPKLTPAQKLAKLQERAAKLQAKIDAGAKAGEAAAQ